MSTGSRSAALALIATALLLGACHGARPRAQREPAASSPPYPPSRLIRAIEWDFAGAPAPRALGSDLWPCTWAADDALYCAWGDGGGFDGNDEHLGRASLGFARVTGKPDRRGMLSFSGRNVWGAPPYAAYSATFGGKISSMISVDGTLYAAGGLWTRSTSAHPALQSGSGPLRTLAWSSDLGRSWQIAPWSLQAELGSFLNFGRDDAGAIDDYVYLYYQRESDRTHLFLKRVPKALLRSDPSTPGLYQYLAGVDARGRAAGWSPREGAARPVFADANHIDSPQVVFDAGLRRYLLSAGHHRSEDASDASLGQLGVFESPHPWGPWRTVSYEDDWGRLGPSASGEFLGLVIPAAWITRDGKTLWCIYSGLRQYDAFNVVRARLKTRWFGLPVPR